jgi:hypothetical protein
MGLTNHETRRSDEGTSGDNKHPDAIHRRADEFHELAKIFHFQLYLRKDDDFNTVRKGCAFVRLIL